MERRVSAAVTAKGTPGTFSLPRRHPSSSSPLRNGQSSVTYPAFCLLLLPSSPSIETAVAPWPLPPPSSSDLPCRAPPSLPPSKSYLLTLQQQEAGPDLGL